MRCRTITAVAALVLSSAGVIPALAQPGPPISTPKPPKPGPILPVPEKRALTVSQVPGPGGIPTIKSDDIFLTTAGGGPIVLSPLDQSSLHYNFSFGQPSSHTFMIPAISLDTNTGKVADVQDYHESQTLFAIGPTPANTSLTAYYFDPATNQYATYDVFAAVEAAVGPNVRLLYPILTVGTTDPLYADVIANVYGLAPPVLSIGEAFSFVDGVSSALPGVLLSTTPFGFDSTNGPSGSGFTGTATVFGIDGLAAVPEPASLGLLALGAAAALAASPRRRRPRPDA